MILTRPVGSVAINDFLHGIHPAERREPGIAQGLFDLRHPESNRSLDAVLHFDDDRLNQLSIRYNGCQSRTQPFWRKNSVKHQPESPEIGDCLFPVNGPADRRLP
jgi:hypothetical protein